MRWSSELEYEQTVEIINRKDHIKDYVMEVNCKISFNIQVEQSDKCINLLMYDT